MTKGTKAFRIIISIFLVLTIVWTALLSVAFLFFAQYYIHQSDYGLMIAGVEVTRTNQHDVLGDGTVSFSSATNKLTLKNAVIEADYAVIYSHIDLRIELIGENLALSTADVLGVPFVEP